MRRVLLYRHIASAAEPPTKDRNISRKGAKAGKEKTDSELGILGVLARE
jgi:hypothetical protein